MLAPVAATALLFAVALASVAIWGRNIGMAEDWSMVPAMTGNQPDLPAWLWSQNNEHRLPVQRLIYLGLLRATGDFRSGMLFSQLLLALLAAALIWAATAARGRPRWRDALFPMALLHLGHWENLAWGWQIQFVWSVVLTGLLLAIVVMQARPLGPRAGLAAALLLLLLPISGANGIVMAVAMAPWLAAEGAVQLGARRWTGLGLIAAALLTFAVIGAYFIGYERPPWSPEPATLPQFRVAAESYFAYALGPGARRVALPAATAVLAFIACGGLLAARAGLLDRTERLRACGLVFSSAPASLSASPSPGRAGPIPTACPIVTRCLPSCRCSPPPAPGSSTPRGGSAARRRAHSPSPLSSCCR